MRTVPQDRSLKLASGLVAVVGLWLVATQAMAQSPAPESAAPRKLLFVTGTAFNRPFKEPSGVWYDTPHGEIYVADGGNHRVVVLDDRGLPKAEFKRTVLKSGTTTEVPGEPSRIAVNSRGDIYIVDLLAQYVEVCDYRGRMLRRIELHDDSLPGGPVVKATAVAIDHRDNVYIASLTRVYVFDAQDRLLRTIGTKGTDPGQFTAITALWVDRNGRIYVTDFRGLAVHVLAADGTVITAFGQHDSGVTNFGLPVGICTDVRNNIWVVDTLRHIVSVFRTKGNSIEYLDHIGAYGATPGLFAFPMAVTGSDNGRLVVTDRVGGRVQCFEF